MRGAQRLAAWLVEKPLNTVLGLALTLLLPFAQFFTGAALTVAVLVLGVARAAMLAAAAAALVAVLSAVTGADVAVVLVNALVFWLPAALVAMLLARTRSLTLTLQVTAIVALAGTLLSYVVLQDPVAFWTGQLEQIAAAFAEMGLTRQADLLVAQRDMLAPQMTVVLVLTSWSLVALVLVLGYWLYQQLPDRQARYGRFSDVNLGRILASAMAVASVLALVSGADWLKSLAFVGFAIFWVQGLALLHWLRVDGPLPQGVLIVVYGLLPILNVLLIMALAVLGYSDAWFNYRSRAGKRPAG